MISDHQPSHICIIGRLTCSQSGARYVTHPWILLFSLELSSRSLF